jgi:hypothetical protein
MVDTGWDEMRDRFKATCRHRETSAVAGWADLRLIARLAVLQIKKPPTDPVRRFAKRGAKPQVLIEPNSGRPGAAPSYQGMRENLLDEAAPRIAKGASGRRGRPVLSGQRA